MKLIVFEEGFAINIDKIEWISNYSANKTHIFVGDSNSPFTVHKPFEEVVSMIDNNASEQEQATGYWVEKEGPYPGWLYCSKCDEPWTFNCGAPPYCPSCGKKMNSEIRKVNK